MIGVGTRVHVNLDLDMQGVCVCDTKTGRNPSFAYLLFDQWPKLYLGYSVQPKIQVLKVI